MHSPMIAGNTCMCAGLTANLSACNRITPVRRRAGVFRATQMRHLPGEQFHSSHRIAENDDLLRGTGENYWGGIIADFGDL